MYLQKSVKKPKKIFGKDCAYILVAIHPESLPLYAGVQPIYAGTSPLYAEVIPILAGNQPILAVKTLYFSLKTLKNS